MKKGSSIFRILFLIIMLSFLLVNLTTSMITRFDSRTAGQMDRQAVIYIDQSLKKALLAFGMARAMNSAISFFQETTLAVQPLGMGVELPVGQVLDPVNDMIERASWVFLMSATALGVQRLFLEISQWAALSVVLNLFLVCVILALFMKRIGVDVRSAAVRLGLLLLFIRCFIPLSYMANARIYDQFMAPTVAAQLGVLEKQQAQMDQLSETTRTGIPDKGKIMAVFREITEAVKDISNRLVKLITVFIAQVIVLPLLFLWVFFQGIKQIFFFHGQFRVEPRAFFRRPAG